MVQEKAKKGFFAVEDDNFCFEGYYLKNFTFKGYVIPYFTKNVVEQMNEIFDELEFQYNETNDTFSVTWIDNEYIDTTEYGATDIVLDNNTKIHVYGIGAGNWPWDRYENSNNHDFCITSLGSNKHNMDTIIKHENYFVSNFLKTHFADNYKIADNVYHINNNTIVGKKNDIAQIIHRNNLDLNRILSNYSDNDIISLEIIDKDIAYLDTVKESMDELNMLEEYMVFSKLLLSDIYTYALPFDSMVECLEQLPLPTIKHISTVINDVSIIQNSKTNQISIFIENDDYPENILFSGTIDVLKNDFTILQNIIFTEQAISDIDLYLDIDINDDREL
ncbi:MAG: hypothetical protein ACLRYM_14745 [Thomasclavelia ramosa]